MQILYRLGSHVCFCLLNAITLPHWGRKRVSGHMQCHCWCWWAPKCALMLSKPKWKKKERGWPRCFWSTSSEIGGFILVRAKKQSPCCFKWWYLRTLDVPFWCCDPCCFVTCVKCWMMGEIGMNTWHQIQYICIITDEVMRLLFNC